MESSRLRGASMGCSPLRCGTGRNGRCTRARPDRRKAAVLRLDGKDASVRLGVKGLTSDPGVPSLPLTARLRPCFFHIATYPFPMDLQGHSQVATGHDLKHRASWRAMSGGIGSILVRETSRGAWSRGAVCRGTMSEAIRREIGAYATPSNFDGSPTCRWGISFWRNRLLDDRRADAGAVLQPIQTFTIGFYETEWKRSTREPLPNIWEPIITS